MGFITKAASKLIGSITGTSGQEKALAAQQRQAQESMRQQSMMAAQQAQQAAEQAQQQRTAEELRDQRETAVKAASEQAAKAREGDSGTVDVDIAPDTPVDEDGRRVNPREQFMSDRKKASGLSL